MTINNLNLFLEGVWDWGMFRGCFGNTGIEPTDIDGLVERHGKFLILEAKAKGVKIKQGQRITFDRLVRTGLFTILVMWGDTNKPESALVITHKGEIEYRYANIKTCRQIVSDWFQLADKK